MKAVSIGIFMSLGLLIALSVAAGNHPTPAPTPLPPAVFDTAPAATPSADLQSAEHRYAACATQIHNEFFRRVSIYDFDWEEAGIKNGGVFIDVRGRNAFNALVSNRFYCKG